MQESGLVLAVDGGGSKTQAALLDAAGSTLGRGRAGPCNLNSDPAGAAAALDDAWRQCCAAASLDPARAAGITTISAALAGSSSAVGRERFRRATAAFARALLSSDAYAALLGAFDGGPGILLAIGTGSVACRLDATGFVRLGGWGFPAGDRGGGAWIGLQAASAWLDRLDGVGPDPGDDPLWASLQARVGVGRERIIAWLRAAGPADFAALAPAVLDAADAGSPVARSVRDAAIAHLAALAGALGGQHGLAVALAGGLAPRLAPLLEPALGQALARPADPALRGAWLIGIGRAAAEFTPATAAA